jgi:hypothetical protein
MVLKASGEIERVNRNYLHNVFAKGDALLMHQALGQKIIFSMISVR